MATIQFSEAARNAVLDAIEATAGASAVLKIRTGAAPANCQAADAGTALATINLPADWMAPASGGVKEKSGTWEDQSADASGAAAHWRLYANDGSTCHAQGDVGVEGSGATMIVDNTAFAAGQKFTVTAFTLSAPGA